jgi:hypothetical protein
VAEAPDESTFEQQEMEDQHDLQAQETDEPDPQSGGLDSPMTEEGAGRD